MGTRADFYIGIRDPKWIGSLIQDGFPWNIPCKILIQNNATMYEELVVDYLAMKGGFIRSLDHNWPWPWEDSQLSDYSYYFANQSGEVYAYSMQEKIMFSPLKVMQGEDLHRAQVFMSLPKFPKMGVGYGPDTTKAV